MSYKDHLPTNTEHSRRQYRQIKQVQQTSYIAAPPAITETITDTGATITPPSATQDLLNPLLGDIEDLTDNVLTTINVELDKITGTFHRIQLPDVGAITINFIGLVKNKAEQMFLDFTKENVLNTPTVTFVPPIFGLTQSDLDAEDRITLSVMARDTEDEVRLDAIGGIGGGGVTFPITPPVDSRGNVNTAQDIDLSLTTAHVTKMTLTGDIAITFSNIPATDTQIEWEVEIKQDGIGGHVITSWPAAVLSIPTINSNADAITLVVLRTNDNGTSINTLFSTLGSVSNVSLWANFTAVTNINAGNNDILAVKNLDFDDVASKITGLKTLEFLDDTPNKNITSTANELEYHIPTLESHDFYVGATKVLTINEDVTTVFEIDMISHRISAIGDLAFSLSGGNIIINRFSMEWDGALGVNGSARINVPSNAEFRFQDNGVDGIIFAPFATLGYEIQGVLAINLVDSTIVPTNDGEIQLDGADVLIKSGGLVVNISNVAEFPVTDALFQVIDDIDPTKTWQISLAGVSTADNMLFNFAATASRTYTFGDATGTVVLNPMFEDLDANGLDLVDVGVISQQGGAIPTSGFINMANGAKISWEASPAGTDGTLTYNLSEHFEFSADRAIVSVSGAPIGQSSQRWGTLWATDVDLTGSLTVDGNTIIGNASGDTLIVNATSSFLADIDLSDNSITGVNQIDITTPAGAAVASIIGIDLTPDILEIRLGAATDFLITDNGTTRLEFNNTLLKWQFGGSSLVELPQETQISDRASAPSTPPSGFMSLYVINVAGAQTFKVKFDNGTEKTIADDI